MKNAFAQDVLNGLSASPKSLSSKYFYDDEGSRLFEQIMQLPEYYLTRAEMQIFKEKSPELVSMLKLDRTTALEIVELGAGDGSKTLHLLTYLEKLGIHFVYRPVDISRQAVEQLIANLKNHGLEITIDPVLTDYAHIQDFLPETTAVRWMFFLGSNLGNMPTAVARSFLDMVTSPLKPGDKLLLGLDKDKDPGTILPAYNDAAGVTAAFNLNLLSRINRELEADFDLAGFEHAPRYNCEFKRAESYIRSVKDQTVHIKAIDRTFTFAKGELIKTEVSQKYDDHILAEILEGIPLKPLGKVEDDLSRFMDVGFEMR